MKNNKMLTMIIILLVAVILIGVILFVLLTQFNKPTGAIEPTIDEIVEATVEIPEITTNLADKRVVRLSLKVQTTSKDAAAELTKRVFQVQNIAIQELSEMEQKDLEGKQGKQIFQKSLKTRVNELMQEGEVQEVYFTSFITQ
ncbi:flagellar basal body-associated protein FliL [Lysinibacillus fusiformis]|jgi:flagellar FliL protein|uniref:Flagellar protein FliL n=4 Tax=Lysinibacillus TaxID=400634 RepID=A0A1E4R425_9BACI|nr:MULTISPECIES: flagellar basal body-associated protein FliL [Lysinibacillus]EAZ83838.1 flagellar basal body-associated protein FliL [Bacillus sp. B14905]MBE5085145.1 flagellar basal body-associated protein FliL [Bacillus thuringiensis]HAU34326.1 flagellar basal body-associated protein FliL [Lysinibacillus sp.]AJK88979.1 flagellar basal body-associated protein FliL [Lysinibacillus fusiformis]AMO34627.1 flagellar basal body-associated protein FliL [Lysinibacillus sphaericus]